MPDLPFEPVDGADLVLLPPVSELEPLLDGSVVDGSELEVDDGSVVGGLVVDGSAADTCATPSKLVKNARLRIDNFIFFMF